MTHTWAFIVHRNFRTLADLIVLSGAVDHDNPGAPAMHHVLYRVSV